MNKIIIIMLSIITSSCVNASAVNMFGASVSLNDSCVLIVEGAEQRIEYKPKFSLPGECRLVSHSGTNIVNVKYINGMYILFIENNNVGEGKCSSEYTSVGLSKDLRLYVTSMVKSSLSCEQDQELKSYEYFSKKLKPYTNS